MIQYDLSFKKIAISLMGTKVQLYLDGTKISETNIKRSTSHRLDENGYMAIGRDKRNFFIVIYYFCNYLNLRYSFSQYQIVLDCIQ